MILYVELLQSDVISTSKLVFRKNGSQETVQVKTTNKYEVWLFHTRI